MAFSAFFLLSAAAFFSFPSRIALRRASVRWPAPWLRRSLITSNEAPTIPRCCLTVRRVRFFAISWCGKSKELMEKFLVRGGGEGTLLQKSLSCAADGIRWSRRFDEGFCAAGIGIRSCRFGIGRFCCHHGRRVCPAQRNKINHKSYVSVKENLMGLFHNRGTTD